MVPGATSPIKETQRQRVLRVFNKKYGINYGEGGELATPRGSRVPF